MQLEENPAAVHPAPIRATARQGETPATEACHRHRHQPHLWSILIDPEQTWRGETSATEARLRQLLQPYLLSILHAHVRRQAWRQRWVLPKGIFY